MVEALRALGVGIDEKPGAGEFGADLLVTPAEELLGSTTIDCGQAGTVMRFVPPIAGLALGPTMFDADDSARGRPMGAIIAALRALGVDVNDDGRGSLPFTVHGTGAVAGGAIDDRRVQLQPVRQRACCSRRAGSTNGLDLTPRGRAPAEPPAHRDDHRRPRRARRHRRVARGRALGRRARARSRARDVDIEPDLSNAAPFLAAALVTGGSVTITGWPADDHAGRRRPRRAAAPVRRDRHPRRRPPHRRPAPERIRAASPST